VVSSTNKTDGHNITALLLNGALNTIKKKKRTNNAIVLKEHGKRMLMREFCCVFFSFLLLFFFFSVFFYDKHCHFYIMDLWLGLGLWHYEGLDNKHSFFIYRSIGLGL
jgi:hypothetical protein